MNVIVKEAMKRKNCPVCANELKISIGYGKKGGIEEIGQNCKFCGYGFDYFYGSYKETIGMHEFEWPKCASDVGDEKMEENKREFKRIRLECMTEAKENWVRDKCNANETRGIHVCYRIVC